MIKKMAFTILAIALLLGMAVLPMAFNKHTRSPLVGPEFSSLRYEEIRFDNSGLELAGMLFLPESDGPSPIAVIIHGSGSSRRASAWYLSVARHLQQNGIAVLLPDKRGCEQSDGNWVGADLPDLATDTGAAVDFIRNQERFADSEVGLIGMSQGGWIAPVVAAKDPGIAFVVSMSGSIVTTDQQLLYEEINNISEFTWPFLARLLAPLTTKRIQQMDHFRPISGFDPIPYWKQVDAPKFIAFGGNDTNVPVEDSIAVLNENLGVELLRVYPNGGHAIRNVETNRVQEEFLGDLVAFVLRSQEHTPSE